MKVLFENHTNYIAYIGIIDYDEETNYLGEPIIFELTPHNQCFYESTPKHYQCIIINNKMGSVSLDQTNRKICYPSGLDNWYPCSHANYDVQTYLIEHPEIQYAKIITNDYLKTFMFNELSDQYNTYYNNLIKVIDE